MSGICGIISLSAPEGLEERLAPILEQLKRRGPDGAALWGTPPVVLGHTLLATTPEALGERLPLREAASGCVITADVRLDNREELAGKLGIDLAARTYGDGELILAAYLEWGEDCPNHLLGDFAFAIWDPRSQRLYAARDHMGMRQLIYGAPRPGELVFATEPSAVRRDAPEAFPISLARVADFLEDLEGIDKVCTFFEGISRLPPAHWLTFGQEGLAVQRYWTLELPPELQLPSDEAYEAAFLEVFREAVRCRLRSAGPVGSMLSGGMDSSAVCAVASSLLADRQAGPLPTYSVAGPDARECPETRAIAAASQIPGLAPRMIDHSDLGELRDALVRELSKLGEPFDFLMNLPRAVYETAHGDGVKVILDGGAGDIVFTPGDIHKEFVQKGDWRRVLKDARGTRAFWGRGTSPFRALATACWRATMPEKIQNMVRSGKVRLSQPEAPSETLTPEGLAGRARIAERSARFREHSTAPRGLDPRLHQVLHANLTVGRERYDRVASSFAIEPRDPFMDLRVISFCLALPAEQRRDRGWPKVLLRRAMKGLLPEPVRWRRGKEHLGWATTQALWPEIVRHAANTPVPENPLVRDYISALASIDASDRQSIDATDRDFRILTLKNWLGSISQNS